MRKLPFEILKYVEKKDYTIDRVGESPSKVYIYETMVLKVSTRNIDAEREHQALISLQGHIPVPRVIRYIETRKKSYLLMERISGKPLFQWPMEMAIEVACQGLKWLWRVEIAHPVFSHQAHALETIKNNIPFYQDHWDNDTLKQRFKTPKSLYDYLEANYPDQAPIVLSHGDYYLPNILFDGKKITGMIDFGYMGYFPKERDVSALIKSLVYNYGFQSDYLERIETTLGMHFKPEWLAYFTLYDELI